MAPTPSIIDDNNANHAAPTEDGNDNSVAAHAAANKGGDIHDAPSYPPTTATDTPTANAKKDDVAVADIGSTGSDAADNGNDQKEDAATGTASLKAAAGQVEKLNPDQAKQVLDRYLQNKKNELELHSILPKDAARAAATGASSGALNEEAADADAAMDVNEDNSAMDKEEVGQDDDEANASDSRVDIWFNLERKRMHKMGPASTPAESSGCSCRKSTCILLYCPCFGDGKSCQDSCKCTNCQNPKGINPSSKITLAEKKKRAKKEEKRKKEERHRLQAMQQQKPKPVKEFPSLLMLTVSPGRLGLTLAIVPRGGAQIVAIDPACTFRGQIHVGDRIVTIDGIKVNKLEDVAVGKERVRKFGIVKAPLKPGAVMPAGVGVARSPVNINVAASSAAAAASASVAAAAARTTAAPAAAMPRGGPVVAGRPLFDKRKQTFPFLTELGAISSTDRLAEHKREDLLTELLQWDKKNDINTIAKMGPSRYQVLTIPLKRRETVNKREFDNQCFHQYNKQTKVFDKFLNAWSSYCDGTQEDAANMVLFYLAKRFPQCYVKNFEMATKKNEKINGPPPVELPPDFVSYDGTNDIKWNSRYAELAKYKEEHGDCKVYSKTDLGRWVCSQRSARNQNARHMSEKRVELLDGLDFLWSGVPEGWTKQVKGGCPRQNRAIAAKLVYTDLTIREVLHLGGFTEEELNVIKDQKHTWRTGYVYYKDVVTKKVDNYEAARRSGARIQIEKLVNILNGDDEDKYDQVFGENGHLLSTFLEAADERRRNGIVEKPRSYKKRKRNENEVVAEEAVLDVEEEEEPASKQPHIEIEEEEPVANEIDFQAQGAYEQMNNNAQQVARDLHSWRHQSNYWR